MPDANDAFATLTKFWAVQDGGDYSQLSSLFSDDAVLVDPIYGTFTGGEAIGAFMTMMNTEMAKAGATFRLVELAGHGDVAWAQWEATTSKGPRTGVGVYRTRDGQITYYRDYMNELGH
jgi:steroid Delta-isomerase